MLEGLFTALEDRFPHILRRHKKVSLAITCGIFFFLGVPMVSYAGTHWLTLVDAYGASGIALLWVVFFEVVGLSWGYGAKKVSNALFEMLHFRPNCMWVVCWKFTAPFVTLMLFFFLLFKYQPLRYPHGGDYPVWAECFGFFLSAISIGVIPLYAVYYLIASPERTCTQKLKRGFQPANNRYSVGVQRPVTTDVDLEYIDAADDGQIIDRSAIK